MERYTRREFFKIAGLTGAGLALFPSCVFASRVDEPLTSTHPAQKGDGLIDYGEFETEPIQQITKHFLTLVEKAAAAESPRLATEFDQETGNPSKFGPTWTDAFYPDAFYFLSKKNPDYVGYLKDSADILISGGTEKLYFKDMNNHDIGFVGLSFGQTYELTGDEKYYNLAIAAADRFLSLFNPESSMFSFQTEGNGVDTGHIVDTAVMGLPVLYWAEKNCQNRENAKVYGDYARTAVYAMINSFMRPDGSVYHYVKKNPDGSWTKREFNPPLYKQGYDDESRWARAQAWAALGFTFAYEENPKETTFRDAAKAVLSFIKENTPEDTTFPFDFGKEVPENLRQYKDTSAQAITALAALKLAKLTQDPEEKLKMQNYGRRLLKDLFDNHTLPNGVIKNGNVGYFVIENFLKDSKNPNPSVGLIYTQWAALKGYIESAEAKSLLS